MRESSGCIAKFAAGPDRAGRALLGHVIAPVRAGQAEPPAGPRAQHLADGIRRHRAAEEEALGFVEEGLGSDQFELIGRLDSLDGNPQAKLRAETRGPTISVSDRESEARLATKERSSLTLSKGKLCR